jgi:flagellar hook-length control protein FliK
MISMGIPIDTALNVGTPASIPAGPAAGGSAAASQRPAGRYGTGGCKGSAFHDELRAAAEESRPASSGGDTCSEGCEPSQPAAAQTAEDAVPEADEAQRCHELEPDLMEQWSFLLQVLQGVSNALQSVQAPEDDTAKTLSQLLNILKQLQGASPDVEPPSASAARLSELCDQLKDLAAGAPSAGLPGRVHQLLQDLREYLSGPGWGRMMKAMAAEQSVAASGAEEETSASAAADADPGLPKGSLQAIGHRLRAEAGPVVRDHNPKAAESRPATSPDPASEDAKLPKIEREPLVRLPSAPAAAPAQTGEGGRGLEAPRPGAATAEPSGTLTGVREDPGAPTAGDQQPANDRLLARTFAGIDAAKAEHTEPAEPFDLGTPGQRLLHSHEGGLEKTAEAVEAGKEKQAAATGRSGVFDQIVQRAIVQVKADQSEIRIDLKPDFLGHVRMRIVTENQQVSVRILTELPAVRDMIETGLQQLRSELQNQGLHVDRLEVAVSDDRRQPPRRQARPDELHKAGGTGPVAGTDGPVSNGRVDPIYYQRRAGSAATIDMFV